MMYVNQRERDRGTGGESEREREREREREKERELAVTSAVRGAADQSSFTYIKPLDKREGEAWSG